MLKIGRGANAPPFMVMDVIAAANARAASLPPGAPKIIHMEAGQPGTGAPLGAREAVIRALSDGHALGYTEARGNADLRHRIAAHYQHWYGQTVSPDRILITTGASAAFPLAFLAAFDPGDRVALACPYYPPYVNILRALGFVPVLLPTDAQSRFQPSVAMLAALDPPPAGLLIASPSNPAGTMLSAAEFAEIAAWCQQNGVRLISDEIYHGLTYGKAASTAANCEGAVVINSFSKYFSMTGWRIGWMVLPEDLCRPVDCLAGNFFISAPHISQVAACAAFDCHDELQANVAVYATSRGQLLRDLPAAGFAHLASADGAFYLFADVSDRTTDSAAFCAAMLRDVGIAACPGVDFDPAHGKRFIRMSYCGPPADLIDAAQRLQNFAR